VGWPPSSTNHAATAAFPPLDQSVLWYVRQQAPVVFGLARPRWRLDDLRRQLAGLASSSLAG